MVRLSGHRLGERTRSETECVPANARQTKDGVKGLEWAMVAWRVTMSLPSPRTCYA